MQKTHVSKFKKQPTYGAPAAKPKPKSAWNMDIKVIQPWSVPVFHTTLPPEVLQQMTKISDKIMVDENAKHYGESLAGQVENELELMPELS